MPSTTCPAPASRCPDLTGREDPNWWVRQWVDREDLQGVLPPSLALSRAVEDLPETVADERSEERVREVVAELNAQIRSSRLRGIDGPPIFLRTQDVERVVREWRARAEPSALPRPEPVEGHTPDSRPGLFGRLRSRRRRSAD